MIKNLQNVVERGLCVGCGLCSSFYGKDYILMRNEEKIGLRPQFLERYKSEYLNDLKGLALCPGYKQENQTYDHSIKFNPLIGSYLEIWEGYATDKITRERASSGGIVTALSQYCLEKEGFESVLHIEADKDYPWRNKSVFSNNIDELRNRTGSRYAPSSPCELLCDLNEDSKVVFVGKPCDCAAVRNFEKVENRKKVELIIGFFCAGVPSEEGSLNLMNDNDIIPSDVDTNIYRSKGWPGLYQVFTKETKIYETTYMDSWSYLQKYRHFRCQLCPDGLSEQSDISTGDAWHRLEEESPDSLGKSIIIIRNEKGKQIFHKAMNAGYLKCSPSSEKNIILGQGLTERKKEILGRILSLKLMRMSYPKYNNFSLLKCWLGLPLFRKVKSVIGTIKRLVVRGMYKRKSLNMI